MSTLWSSDYHVNSNNDNNKNNNNNNICCNVGFQGEKKEHSQNTFASQKKSSYSEV